MNQKVFNDITTLFTVSSEEIGVTLASYIPKKCFYYSLIKRQRVIIEFSIENSYL